VVGTRGTRGSRGRGQLPLQTGGFNEPHRARTSY